MKELFVFNRKQLARIGILKSEYNKIDISLSNVWTYVGWCDVRSSVAHLSRAPFVLVESQPLDASVWPRGAAPCPYLAILYPKRVTEYQECIRRHEKVTADPYSVKQ